MTEKEIWDKAYKRIFELYGNVPDLRIVSRFYSEKQTFMQYEVGKYFYDLAKLRREAEEAGERLIVKAPVASCLLAYLLADGICSLSDIPATRDEVFMTIRDAMRDCDFHDTGFAYDVANKARSGYYLEHGMDNYTNSTLQMLGLDSWFGSYIRFTQYMSTKALAVLELKYSIILNWYQVYYPREYQRVMADYNV